MNKETKNRGQIISGGLVAIGLIGTLVIASLGISWKAFDQSTKALEEVSSIKVSIATLNANVEWIRQILENQQKPKGDIQIKMSTSTATKK